MKKLLACLLWASCLLPNLAYAQINPKDLVGVWLLDSLNDRKIDKKGYFILYENGFSEEAMIITSEPIKSKWYFANGELILRQEGVRDNAGFFQIVELDNKHLILKTEKGNFIFKKITQEGLNTLKNAPELEEEEKRRKEEVEQEAKEKREKFLPYCANWTCKVGKNKITLQLTDDGHFTYRAGKEQASGSWDIDAGVLELVFFLEGATSYYGFGQSYRLQILSQTDKELKTKDFLTQTILVWRR
ncbi:MAG: hypothetical protein EAZ95_12840 [Bacteroidetes bacterium]|nr:MAG: hypothetical protein EAZ95_12840 [Bacteroidota bacterium]